MWALRPSASASDCIERIVEPFELGFESLTSQVRSTPAERQAGDRQPGESRRTPELQDQPGDRWRARDDMKTQASSRPFIDLGMTSPSSILSGLVIRARRLKSSSTGSANLE